MYNWRDNVSDILYRQTIAESSRWEIPASATTIVDLGGYNALTDFFPECSRYERVNIESIDVEFRCDIVDFQASSRYDLAIIRHVLHYNEPAQQQQIIDKARSVAKHVLLIQFANDGTDLDIKKSNSVDGAKRCFLSSFDLLRLIRAQDVVQLAAQSYQVGKDFYLNRFEVDCCQAHGETVFTILLRGE